MASPRLEGIRLGGTNEGVFECEWKRRHFVWEEGSFFLGKFTMIFN